MLSLRSIELDFVVLLAIRSLCFALGASITLDMRVFFCFVGFRSTLALFVLWLIYILINWFDFWLYYQLLFSGTLTIVDNDKNDIYFRKQPRFCLFSCLVYNTCLSITVSYCSPCSEKRYNLLNSLENESHVVLCGSLNYSLDSDIFLVITRGMMISMHLPKSSLEPLKLLADLCESCTFE